MPEPWGKMMAYRFGPWDCVWQLSCRLAAEQRHWLTQAAPTPSAPATPLVNVSGTGALVFIAVVALAVAILWFIPTFIDLRQTNRWRSRDQSKLLDQMVKAADNKGLSVDDLRQIASAMNTPPRGMQGLTQALIGLIIITLVGVAMVTTLVSTAADSSDLRKTIITALLSVLATIAGFYFGARTAQISTEQATRPPAVAGQPQKPPDGSPTVPSADEKTLPDETGQPTAPSAGEDEQASQKATGSEARRTGEQVAATRESLAGIVEAIPETGQPQGDDPAAATGAGGNG
jgi:hypothetical protein